MINDLHPIYLYYSLSAAFTTPGRATTSPGRAAQIDIDVEQIGYIYEGLLGYTCARAAETVLGLCGKEGEEPEVPLSVLEGLAEVHSDDTDLVGAVIAWLKKNRPGAKPPSEYL